MINAKSRQMCRGKKIAVFLGHQTQLHTARILVSIDGGNMEGGSEAQDSQLGAQGTYWSMPLGWES